MQKIVFTNGCFDIIHPGHVRFLEEAKALGTKLVVGINSDASVRSIKGPTRPVQDQKSRRAVLLGLTSVGDEFANQGQPRVDGLSGGGARRGGLPAGAGC